MSRKYLDEEGLLYLWGKIKEFVNAGLTKKVDTVVGKGLSTNDFTDELKTQLLNAQPKGDYATKGEIPTKVGTLINDAGYQTAAQVTASIKNKADKSEIPTLISELTNDSNYQTAQDVNATISGKADKTEIPKNVSDLTNDSGFQTASQVQTAISGKADKSAIPTKLSQLTNDKTYQTLSEVNSLIATAVGKIDQFKMEVVASLPTTGKTGTIYLVPSKTTGTNQSYDEYIYVNSKWEFIGTTAPDLSAYVKSSELVAITNGEIDTIFA